MGMARPQTAEISTAKLYFNTVIANGAVSSGEFGFLLAESGAVFYLGGVDSSVVDGNFNTVPVTQEGYQ
jgi:cathepsin D